MRCQTQTSQTATSKTPCLLILSLRNNKQNKYVRFIIKVFAPEIVSYSLFLSSSFQCKSQLLQMIENFNILKAIVAVVCCFWCLLSSFQRFWIVFWKKKIEWQSKKKWIIAMLFIKSWVIEFFSCLLIFCWILKSLIQFDDKECFRNNKQIIMK